MLEGTATADKVGGARKAVADLASSFGKVQRGYKPEPWKEVWSTRRRSQWSPWTKSLASEDMSSVQAKQEQLIESHLDTNFRDG